MAKSYRVTRGARLINAVFKLLTRLGLGARYRHVLGVRGRTTGRWYETPVDVMDEGGQRWLVAAYGVVNWVKNARAAGEATLTRKKATESVLLTEVPADEAVPVLRKYLREVPVTRSYFDVTADSTDEAFAAEARSHPVFKVTALPAEPGSRVA